MSTTVIVLIVMAVVAAVTGAAVTLVALNRPKVINPALHYEWRANEHLPDQWVVRTVDGPCVVTHVFSDDHGGWCYEIETSFKRDATRLHYVAPSKQVVERTLTTLIEKRHAATG